MLRCCFIALLLLASGPLVAQETLQPFIGENGKWGFCIDSKEVHNWFNGERLGDRKVKIAAQFAWVGVFRDGMARVTREGRTEKQTFALEEAKWGWIDEDGKEVIPCQFDMATDMYEGVALFEAGKKWGAVDKTGRIIVPAEYDDVVHVSEERIRVEKDKKLGFYDIHGSLIVPIQYDFATDYKDGFSVVARDNKYGWLDKEGHEIALGVYDRVVSFSEELAAVQKDGKWGYADTTGALVIPPKWEYACPFAMSIAAVKLNGLYGYINRRGAVIIEPQFGAAHPFSEAGVAVVQEPYVDPTNPFGRGKECLFIRQNGERAFPTRFSFAGDLVNGSATVSVIGRKETFLLRDDGSLEEMPQTPGFQFQTFGPFWLHSPDMGWKHSYFGAGGHPATTAENRYPQIFNAWSQAR